MNLALQEAPLRSSKELRNDHGIIGNDRIIDTQIDHPVAACATKYIG